MTPGKVMGEGRFRVCMFGRQPMGFTGSLDLAREKVIPCVCHSYRVEEQDMHAQYTQIHGPSSRAGRQGV